MAGLSVCWKRWLPGKVLSMNTVRKRIIDLCLLAGSALIICIVGVGAFVISEARHISPMWGFFGLLSIGFFAGVGWDYRSEFRSFRFVLFFSTWLLLNFVIFCATRVLGWLYLVAVFIELVLFYASAYWLFGLQPPVPRQRTR